MTVEAKTPAQEHVPKKRRGRESVSDMVRSLGLVMIMVVIAWYLAQPNSGDEQTIRVVDTAATISQTQRDNPGVPVPTGVPAGFRPTSATETPEGLRIGYVTPTDQYAEYVLLLAPTPAALSETTGRGVLVGDFRVGDVLWQQYQAGEDTTSLARTVAGRTVVLGGTRETTTLDELSDLAATVRP